MPEWQLAFPIATLDDRINMRAAIARLQTDPHHVRTVLTERRDRHWVYRVEFEGMPDDPEILRLRESYQHYVYATWDRLVNGPNRNGDVIDPEVARQVLQNYLATPPERRRIGPLIGNPLRPRIDYQGVARSVFIVDELPQGALPVYDRDPDPGTTPRTLETGVESFENIIREGLRLNREEPFTPPDWLRPGTWLRGKADNELVCRILHVEENQQVIVENWRRQPERVELPARVLAQDWEPCATPREPTSRFDRMLERNLTDPEEKTASVSIYGKPTFMVRWRQSFQRFTKSLLGKDSTILANPPEVEWDEGPPTRFERLNRDE